MKSSEVSIKRRSTPASLSFKGQATKHSIVKRSFGSWLESGRRLIDALEQLRSTREATDA